MTSRMIFQKNLKYFMEHDKVNQTDIAKALGVNRSTVSAWITGRGFPRADIIQQIAMYFGVRVSDLVLEVQEETEDDRLLKLFRSLNSVGKAKLIERAEELKVLYGSNNG